jgi:DNA-binding MarR family transcriptional regulator
VQNLEKQLADYLKSITGTHPDIQKDVADRARTLALFLRERYGLRSLRIFGRKCLLAIETSDWEPGSPAEYASHAQALQSALGEPVAIVIPRVPSYARNRMVHAGIPFIVPGSQLFLPSMMVDLRERFSQVTAPPGERLKPATQCVLLYHLLRKRLDGLPLREIAKMVGYSAMNLTRAKDELESAELCKTGRDGRSVVMEFRKSSQELFQKALPLLSSPVKKAYWVDWPSVGYPAIPAGLTALSLRTMIDDDRIPTFALPQDTYRQNLEKGLFHGCPGPFEANVKIEAWTYNPLLLGDQHGVDSLSLFLSLRDSADERVQQQLETMIREVKWA